MSMTVQLDLFNTLVPIKTFDWGHKRDLKIFEYNEDMSFTDPSLEHNFVVNVPCYKLESLVGIVADKQDETFRQLSRNKDLQDCVVRIYEQKGRRSWNNTYYVLANAKTKKFIEQNFLFAKLKGNINKMPRITRKTVEIESIDEYRNDLDCAWVMAKVCWAADHILDQLEE